MGKLIFIFFIGYGCKKFETIGKEEISYLWKSFKIHVKQCYCIV